MMCPVKLQVFPPKGSEEVNHIEGLCMVDYPLNPMLKLLLRSNMALSLWSPLFTPVLLLLLLEPLNQPAVALL